MGNFLLKFFSKHFCGTFYQIIFVGWTLHRFRGVNQCKLIQLNEHDGLS